MQLCHAIGIAYLSASDIASVSSELMLFMWVNCSYAHKCGGKAAKLVIGCGSTNMEHHLRRSKIVVTLDPRAQHPAALSA
jgi:hypothetical protein